MVGGVVLADPCLDKDYDDDVRALSKNKEIFFWISVSAVDGVMFSYFENAQCLRKWVSLEAEVVINEGEAFSDEGIFDAKSGDEDELDISDILELCAKNTGVSSDYMFDGIYDVYR